MENRTLQQPLASRTLLHGIAAAEDATERRELLDDFAREHDRAYRAVARQMCGRYQLGADVVDDVLQIVHITALDVITKLVSHPEDIDTIHSWVGYVKSHARNAVQQFVDKDATAPMTEMSSKFRRLRLAAKVRADLEMSLGREPTDDEILKTANRRYEDKPKQTNMILSKADLSWDSVRVKSIDDEHVDVADASDDDEDPPIFLLADGESRAFLKDALAVLKASAGEEAAEIAQQWLSPALKKRGGGALSWKQAAETCDVDVAVVHEVATLMRGAAMRVLRERVEADPEHLERLEEYARENGYDRVT